MKPGIWQKSTSMKKKFEIGAPWPKNLDGQGPNYLPEENKPNKKQCSRIKETCEPLKTRTKETASKITKVNGDHSLRGVRWK